MDNNNFIFDTVDRSQLSPYIGKQIAFEGKVQRVVAPTKDTKLVCLQNVVVAEIDNNVRFNERRQVFVRHIWLDVSEVTHLKHKMYMEVQGCATVVEYTRKDQTKALGLVFKDHGWTEAGYRHHVIKALALISTSDSSVQQKAEDVNTLIFNSKKLIESGQIVLFDTTAEEEYKNLRFYKDRLMLAAGCTVTLNRSGLRSLGKPRHKAQKTVIKRGFA